VSITDDEGFFRATVKTSTYKVETGPQLDALISRVTERFEQYVKLSQNLNYETMIAAIRVDESGKLSDTVGANLQLTIEEKQELLEIFDPIDRLTRVAEMLDIEIEKLNVDRTIQGRVKKQMEKAQKEYYLNEKIKAIQKELGRGEKSEIDELKRRIEEAGMTSDAQEKALAELKRLENMPPMSAESTVSRNYLDWLLAVPWKKKSKEIRDLKFAETVLESDHYGLEKIKSRIVEYLAVRKLAPQGKAPILCFVGPPGVGKTSLGQSIARAMGRPFVRVSLGGVHDEAEIRGHRRTYIGALPGNIIQSIKKAGSRNCVMMLDEIDKMGRGIQGDPSAAMLEVLDPEQNSTFRDNYLGVPFDLSRVVFVATANMLDTIPGPLQDRMEIISLAGYTEDEKLEIARRYLVPRQREANGLKPEQAEIDVEALSVIIKGYTREAGVRSLEREIGKAFRHAAVQVAEGSSQRVTVAMSDLTAILGQPRFESEIAMRTSIPGVATGLAWTPVGGDILFIEATRIPGKGAFSLTGQLGDVMRESAQAAFTLVKSRASQLGIEPSVFEKSDIHVHVPAGATPKDGPSAGVAMFVALASLLTNRTVRSDTAMTGEISLRGLVLPVGGIKEKVVAAAAAGLTRVMLPARNRRDFDEIPQGARDKLEFLWLERIDDAIAEAMNAQAALAAD
jgi:ATP-dependent Lon protease